MGHICEILCFRSVFTGAISTSGEAVSMPDLVISYGHGVLLFSFVCLISVMLCR